MYDELVMNLRDLSNWSDFAWREYSESGKQLIKQAADAIEVLLAERDEVNADSWKTAFEVERDEHRWIPVTERLPKAERKSYWVCTDTGYQCECRWTNDRFGIRESDKWGWKIFDIPQYQKVVAWMPLPEPPKEETRAS